MLRCVVDVVSSSSMCAPRAPGRISAALGRSVVAVDLAAAPDRPRKLAVALRWRLATNSVGASPQQRRHTHARSDRSRSAVAWSTMPAASRSGSSGSPTVPVSASSGPWAIRVCRGGTGASRPVVCRRPARMSSGLTAGVPCRRTMSSIAHSWPSTCPDARRQAARRPPGSRRSARPSWSSAPPRPRRGRGTPRRRRPPRPSGTPGSATSQAAGLEPVGQRARASRRPRRRCRAVGQRLVERRRAPARGRSSRVTPISRYSASELAPGRRGVGVRDARVRVEARTSRRSAARPG